MRFYMVTCMKKFICVCLRDLKTVCKLLKSIYSLKQASRQWFPKLTSALLSLGYMQSSCDFSLFVRASTGSFTALLVYVDDIILAGNDLFEFARVKQFLDHAF